MMLQSREIKKSGYNSFAKYAYMELADFLVPTQQIFAEIGLCGVVSFTKDEAKLIITDADNPMDFGASIIITSPMGSAALKGCHEVQNIGAVETYQRRYLWSAAMEIVEHDAIDSAPPAKPAPNKGDKPVESFKDDPKGDAFNALQPEVQLFLRKVAQQVLAAMPQAGDAINIMEMAVGQWPDEDPAELKKGIWHLLDSTTRSAIKKYAST
jgi:hypothetical protein